jgi:hypothetical protein
MPYVNSLLIDEQAGMSEIGLILQGIKALSW